VATAKGGTGPRSAATRAAKRRSSACRADGHRTPRRGGPRTPRDGSGDRPRGRPGHRVRRRRRPAARAASPGYAAATSRRGSATARAGGGLPVDLGGEPGPLGRRQPADPVHERRLAIVQREGLEGIGHRSSYRPPPRSPEEGADQCPARQRRAEGARLPVRPPGSAPVGSPTMRPTGGPGHARAWLSRSLVIRSRPVRDAAAGPIGRRARPRGTCAARRRTPDRRRVGPDRSPEPLEQRRAGQGTACTPRTAAPASPDR